MVETAQASETGLTAALRRYHLQVVLYAVKTKHFSRKIYRSAKILLKIVQLKR